MTRHHPTGAGCHAPFDPTPAGGVPTNGVWATSRQRPTPVPARGFLRSRRWRVWGGSSPCRAGRAPVRALQRGRPLPRWTVAAPNRRIGCPARVAAPVANGQTPVMGGQRTAPGPGSAVRGGYARAPRGVAPRGECLPRGWRPPVNVSSWAPHGVTRPDLPRTRGVGPCPGLAASGRGRHPDGGASVGGDIRVGAPRWRARARRTAGRPR